MNKLAVIAAALSVVTATVASAVVAPAAFAGPPQWTIQATTNPTASDGLQAVSCPSASACLAVGATGSNPTAAIAESWNGTSWTTTTPSPAPVKVASSSLQAVSCTSATACMAVGFWDDGSRAQHILAESWSGSSWSLQFPAASALATGMRLSAVSCPAVTACMAVGIAHVPAISPGTWVTVAESWNGSTWTLDNTPNPLGAVMAGLGGVSCPAALVCAGVGAWTSVAAHRPPYATLAERYA